MIAAKPLAQKTIGTRATADASDGMNENEPDQNVSQHAMRKLHRQMIVEDVFIHAGSMNISFSRAGMNAPSINDQVS